jgi:hypothetical protein
MSVSCCQKLGDREIVGDRELELFAIVAEPAGVARLLLFARLERLEPSGLCDRLFVGQARASSRLLFSVFSSGAASALCIGTARVPRHHLPLNDASSGHNFD